MGLVKYVRVQWDRCLAVVLGLLGLLALLLGWLGVSGNVFPAAQLPYVISGGLTAIFLLGGAATFWLSADLRDEWRHLDSLQRQVEQYVSDEIEHRVEAAVRSALHDAKSALPGEEPKPKPKRESSPLTDPTPKPKRVRAASGA
jgi:hypothetical protein